MNYSDFYYKKFPEFTLKELNWVANNSYIDYFQYYGKILQLQNKKYEKSKYLIKDFKILKNIEKLYFNKFIKNPSINIINIINEIHKNYFIFYKSISKNIDLFISNINNIKEFINLYYLLNDLQTFVANSNISIEDKKKYRLYYKGTLIKSKEKMLSRIDYIKEWGVRRNSQNKVKGKIEITRAIHYFSLGERDKAINILKNSGKDIIKFKTSSYYYYYIMLNYLNNNDYGIRIYSLYENFNIFADKDLHRQNIIYLILYKFKYFNKQQVIEIIKKNSIEFFKIKYDRVPRAIFEPILVFIPYLLMLYDEDELFYNQNIIKFLSI